MKCAALVLILACYAAYSNALSITTVNNIRTGLRGLLDANLTLFGGFLRLAFHNCVGTSCDGCVNLAQADNAGLATYVQTLESYYTSNSLSGVIYRADFWALAGSEAVIYATELDKLTPRSATSQCGTPPLVFKWGRIDCPTAPNTATVFTFPSAHGNNAQTLRFFATEFGFSSREAVAILGAHTLGKAHSTASGFRGPWDTKPAIFSNAYYQDMQDSSLAWTQANVGSKNNQLWQWNSNRSPSTLMLNADMSMVKDFPATSTGLASCSFSTCPTSASATDVAYFASNNCPWITEFSAAFTKMISKGSVLSDLT